MGTGSIGSKIAKFAKFHGLKTLGTNSSGRDVDNFEETFDTNQLPNVIGSVNFIVNTLPGTSQTRVLYDKEFFKGMNQEGYFISVGRGDAVI